MVGTVDVGVVIPTYFRNEGLLEAIDSVLAQTVQPTEIVVVDDSGEGHASDCRWSDDRITYLCLGENYGPQVAREIGLKRCDTEYIQLLDDDDRLRPDAIEKRLARFESEHVGVVYSGIRWDNGHVASPRKRDTDDILAAALSFDIAACTTSNMLINRSYLDAIRPLTGEYTGAGDLALTIWLAEQTKFAFVDEPLLEARGNHDSLGISEQAIRSRFHIIEDFEWLYAQHPPPVKRRALADTYALLGRRRLRDRRWSASAIVAFGRAAYLDPERTSYRSGEFISSIGGRPTRQMAARVSDMINARRNALE